MENDIEYVIYCRKSTDESSNKQAQSIPDQIKRCIEYAEQNGLKIMAKPSDFSDFENEHDIWKEDHDKEIEHRKIYQQTRNLFIIKEQKSGKIPFKREKWNQLMKLIDKGKVKGLLSYSPDRQARNVVEGGMIINYVDEDKLDLKYTNFYFENNASGKMLLGMRFVFSKQYSDKLSEDIRRGNESSATKGKAGGIEKYGYIIDKETGFHKPDGDNFFLMKKAYDMKIYERKSDREIVERLNSSGFKRGWNNTPITIASINNIWKDPFYYGIFQRGKVLTDLIEKNPFFKPLITKEEFDVLQVKYQDKLKRYVNIKKKEEFDDITPLFPGTLVHKETGLTFSRYIPSIKRHRDKLDKLKERNPNATLADVIKPHQIYYKAQTKDNSVHIEIHFEDVYKGILKLFNSIKLTDKGYEDYRNFLMEKLDKIEEQKRKERKIFHDHIEKLTKERNGFILQNMGKKRTNDEELVYKNQINDYNKQIEIANENAGKIVFEERDSLIEFEALADIILNAGKYYKNFNYVQQANIIKLLVSNIYVDNKKRLTFVVNPGLESLFSKNSIILLLAGIEPASNP